MTDQIPRRTLVRGIGLAAAAGVLAGCSTETRGDGGDGGGDGGDGGTGTGTADGGGGGNGNGDGGDGGGVPTEVQEYLSDAQGYEGGVEDLTGEDGPTVDVGAGNGLSFAPAAIRVSQGTSVTWVWTGQGGGHNVVHEGDAFRSGDTVADEGHEWSYTFEETGSYRYFCDPHKASGMKGAVIVE